MSNKKNDTSLTTNPESTWGPTSAGKTFTSTPDWQLRIIKSQFELEVAGQIEQGDILDLGNVSVRPGIFWAAVIFPMSKGQNFKVDGIPNENARALVQHVRNAVNIEKRKQYIDELIRNFSTQTNKIVQWVNRVSLASKSQLAKRGWLSKDFVSLHNKNKPTDIPKEIFTEPEIVEHIKTQPANIQSAINVWQRSFDEVASGINERQLTNELSINKAFFDSVEKSPLTEEQAKAVVCFDDRVLLVAAAGSGKTSTMVAKAGYALRKGYFAADKILLLAFNNEAAKELRERINARLTPLGLSAEQVTASTFHAFGLNIIGQATGKKPSLAKWLDSGQDIEALLQMVDDLKDRDLNFRTNWDLFRLVLGEDLPEFGKEASNPDSWNPTTKTDGFWTLNNEVVKSRGELLIANWFFYNGVKYVYEPSYTHATADALHRQYTPDFYLPDIDAYLEHWALDEKGEPPAEFKGYKESLLWKRKVHAQFGTKLIETTMAQLWSGQAFQHLANELSQRGIQLDPNPDRPVPGRKPIENPRLANTFRSFLTHAKSNRIDIAALCQKLETGHGGQFQFRSLVFIQLFEQIWQAWEGRLKREDCIDFDDMLNLASDCIEQGKWESPYEMVMIDEFQDASQARARLVANLAKSPNTCLFAVGDDWQSINRFAGADLSVMTDFEALFGRSVTLKLETTFRCPQALCDISSAFIAKNPKQLKKKVRSGKPNIADPVKIIRVRDESRMSSAIEKILESIASAHLDPTKKLKVYVLGRYNRDRAYLPRYFDTSKLEVAFITAHSSKGLEADHIIIPRVTSETLGFPSRIEDDPVLQLAMPHGDNYENAEERRLFYVALTRAKLGVSILTIEGKESKFVTELVKDHQIKVTDIEGKASQVTVCPACNEGTIIQKNGRYGPFLACSRFPKCKHKPRMVK